jgi:hypothetical protein
MEPAADETGKLAARLLPYPQEQGHLFPHLQHLVQLSQAKASGREYLRLVREVVD